VLLHAMTAKDKLRRDGMNRSAAKSCAGQLRHLRVFCVVTYEKAGFAAFSCKSSLSYASA
jgi:hypothetical protein